MITLEQVEARVKEIEAARGDDEIAHGMEDTLRGDVLRSVAAGVYNASALAIAALETDQIIFSRWCA